MLARELRQPARCDTSLIRGVDSWKAVGDVVVVDEEQHAGRKCECDRIVRATKVNCRCNGVVAARKKERRDDNGESAEVYDNTTEHHVVDGLTGGIVEVEFDSIISRGRRCRNSNK